jgi:hypothetical protein
MRAYGSWVVALVLLCYSLGVQSQCPTIVVPGEGKIDLNNIPPEIFHLKEKYDNDRQEDKFLWPISFCNRTAVPHPDHIQQACNERGFLEEFSALTVSCENSFHIQSQPWTFTGSSVHATFENSKSWKAHVTIHCSPDDRIHAVDPVIVDHVNGNLTWALEFYSRWACPNGNDNRPPILPNAFYGDFIEFTAPMTRSPPYYNGIPQAPFKASRGRMYYDWNIQAMMEVRLDYCVNIFNFSNDFPCTFLNVNATSYLISSGTPNLPSCCVFGQPWYPPPPNFLRDGNVTVSPPKVRDWDCERVDWFEVPSIQPPTGPFWFSFFNRTWEHQVYRSFSFPGMEGWVQQNFDNITRREPPSSVWELPQECQGTIPNCGFGVSAELHPWAQFANRKP